jgi:PAS domain S-box-containing protein
MSGNSFFHPAFPLAAAPSLYIWGAVACAAAAVSLVIYDLLKRREMERRIAAHVHDLSLLNEASRALLFGMGVRETAEYLCGLTVERLGHKIAWIGLANQGDTQIRPLAVRGAASFPGDLRLFAENTTDSGEGPTAIAFRTARAVITNDVETGALHEPRREFARREGYRSSAALPLISGDAVLGVMNVYDARPHRFTDERVSLLQSLANLAASAIATAVAHTELRRRAAELESAVERLRESEARLQLALDAGRMGVWERNLRTGQLTWSPATERLFGLEPGSFEGSYEAFLARIHPDERAELQALHEHGRREGAVQENEFRVIWPDGTVKWIATRGKYVLDEQGQPLRASGVVMDIDDRKRAQETARRQQSDMAHLLRVNIMAEMASGLAHEINQPLTAISNFAGAALQLEKGDKLSGEKAREILGDIHQQAHRAGEVVRRLRSFIKKRPAEVTSADLNTAVSEALALMSPELTRAKVRLKFTPATELPPINVDPVQIQQVVVNLVQNAVDAMEHLPTDARSLAVAVDRRNGQVVTRVTDSGKGIPPDDAPKVFERFYSTKPAGLGMGLNISRSIVESHGGSLDAFNNPAGGATFEFVLPLPPS